MSCCQIKCLRETKKNLCRRFITYCGLCLRQLQVTRYWRWHSTQWHFVSNNCVSLIKTVNPFSFGHNFSLSPPWLLGIFMFSYFSVSAHTWGHTHNSSIRPGKNTAKHFYWHNGTSYIIGLIKWLAESNRIAGDKCQCHIIPILASHIFNNGPTLQEAGFLIFGWQQQAIRCLPQRRFYNISHSHITGSFAPKVDCKCTTITRSIYMNGFERLVNLRP